jgi:hypothetical protein
VAFVFGSLTIGSCMVLLSGIFLFTLLKVLKITCFLVASGPRAVEGGSAEEFGPRSHAHRSFPSSFVPLGSLPNLPGSII